MREPVTTVDARFSQKDAQPTPWSDTVGALESGEIFWITTVRADGRPHVTPLVAVWLDDALYFSTGDGEQKEVNLRHNDHVILTTGRNDWESGLDVIVEGRASRVVDQGRADARRRGLDAQVGRRQLAVRGRGRLFPSPGE